MLTVYNNKEILYTTDKDPFLFRSMFPSNLRLKRESAAVDSFLSRFILVLIFTMPNQDVAHRSSLNNVDSSSPVVLLVEDNVELLGILQSVFVRHGFQVQAASSVEGALPFLLDQTPDIVVSDVMLPGKSGYDLHRELRRNPEWYDIPFVFLTALSHPEDIARGKMSGCDDYVTKPFNPEELVAVVRGRINLSEHRRRMETMKLEGYRKRVLNTLSHEFRTPLVAIKAGAEILADRQEMQAPEIKSLLEAIQRGGERLERLVNNFLLLQQVDLGQASQACETFRRRVSAVVLGESALNSFPRGREGAVIHLLDEVGDSGLGLLVDVYDLHITHALHHLLGNAVKFASSHGPIHFTLKEEGSNVVFSVRDFGPGLAEAHHLEACDAFTQVDRETNEQQGAGLGLTVAKYFVEMNGGRLVFERPEDGQGLLAKIIFPRAL